MDLGAPNARAKVVKKNKKTNPHSLKLQVRMVEIRFAHAKMPLRRTSRASLQYVITNWSYICNSQRVILSSM